MKRIIPLMMASIVLVLSLAVPSYAAEAPTPELIEVLELALPNGSNGHQVYRPVGSQNVSASFNLPEQNTFYYIDVLFTVPTGYTPTRVWLSQAASGSVHTELTLVNVSGSLWRAYANTNYNPPGFFLHFTGGMGWVEFKSVRISTVPLSAYDERAKCEITAYNYNQTINYIPTDIINYRTFLGSSTPELNQLHLLISCDNWRKYDYLDFSLACEVSTITSIVVALGDTIVPFSSSVITSPGSIQNHYLINVRIDLTNINRTSTELLHVEISGSVNLGSDNFISMEGCRGLLISSSVNPLISLVQRIYTAVTSGFRTLGQKLDNIHEVLQGNLTSGNQFKDESSGLIDGLGDITAEIDSVTRPVMSDIDADFSADITDTTVLLGSLFSEVNKIQWLARLVLASVTMGLIAYILYGKE